MPPPVAGMAGEALQRMLRGIRERPVDQEEISALWPLPAGSEYSLPPASGRVSTLSTAGTGLLSSWVPLWPLWPSE